MARHPTSARDRLVSKTGELLRRQGYHATGLNQIVEESQAPKGSLYHYFPGGKEELAVEAVHLAARQVEGLLEAALAAGPNTREALRTMILQVTETLKNSTFQDACPLSMVALETSTISPALQQACSAAFARMVELIQQSLERDGYEAEQAGDYANLVVSAYEGGLLLSRTHRDTAPLVNAMNSIGRLLPPPPAR